VGSPATAVRSAVGGTSPVDAGQATSSGSSGHPHAAAVFAVGHELSGRRRGAVPQFRKHSGDCRSGRRALGYERVLSEADVEQYAATGQMRRRPAV
jgi:hypothetical protein